MSYVPWFKRMEPITLGERFELDLFSTRAKPLSPTKSYAQKPYNWEEGDWWDLDDESVGNTKILEDFEITDEMRRRPNAAGGRIGFGDGTTLEAWIEMHGYGDKETIKIKELIEKYKKPLDSKVSNEAKSAIAKARLTGFAQDFKKIFRRKPSGAEVRNLINADFKAIKKYLTSEQLLTSKESKEMAQNLESVQKKQRKTLLKTHTSKGVNEPRVVIQYAKPGKQGATITGSLWPSEKVKANYIKDFLKNYEKQPDGSYVWRKNWKPEGALTSEQKALRYLPEMAKKNMSQAKSAIANLNKAVENELTKEGKFKWKQADTKESKIKRTERVDKGNILAGEDARMINAKQKTKLAELNKFFKNNPKAIFEYPKLMALIDTGFDSKTGTITKKGHDAAYYLNKAKSGLLFAEDHITRVATERANIQYPINKQFVPQNFNQGTLTSMQAWLNKNWNNKEVAAQKNKLLDFFKKYNLRVKVEGVNAIQGAKELPSIHRATNTLPNIEANLEALGLSSKKISPVTLKSEVIPGASKVEGIPRYLQSIGKTYKATGLVPTLFSKVLPPVGITMGAYFSQKAYKEGRPIDEVVTEFFGAGKVPYKIKEYFSMSDKGKAAEHRRAFQNMAEKAMTDPRAQFSDRTYQPNFTLEGDKETLKEEQLKFFELMEKYKEKKRKERLGILQLFQPQKFEPNV